jgi:hypothetical protein
MTDDIELQIIETCIAKNLTITDFNLRDGVYAAIMDALAMYKEHIKQENMRCYVERRA